MLDVIARSFLLFSNEIIIVPLVIIGYIWVNKKEFFYVICLVIISMIFNAALKVTFKIPLPDSVNKGWFAFPSGHMQTVVVLYGYLFHLVNNLKFRLFVIGIFCAVAFGLIHFGYHNIFDILGALFFGGILLHSYLFFKRRFSIKVFSIVIIFLNSLLLLYIWSSFKMYNHLLACYFALFGILGSEMKFGNNNIKTSLKQKIFATVICFSVIFIINILFMFNFMPKILFPIRWFLVGGTIPLSLFIVKHIKINNKIAPATT